jgi:hypothetical protein
MPQLHVFGVSSHEAKNESMVIYELGDAPSLINHRVKFVAAASAILREDGKDPSRDLGPPVHSWGTWSGTKQSVPWQKTLVRAPSI